METKEKSPGTSEDQDAATTTPTELELAVKDRDEALKQRDNLLVEFGEILDYVENDLGVKHEKNERVSALVKRAFKDRTTVVGDDGVEKNVLVLREAGARMLLSMRAKRNGVIGFGNVICDQRDGDWNYSFRREGKTDEFTVMSDVKLHRRLQFSKPRLQERLGELASQVRAINDKAQRMKNSLELTTMNYERRSDRNRDLGEEQANIDHKESEIRVLTGNLPSIENEILEVKRKLEEIDAVPLSSLMRKHEIPSKTDLEVTVSWPLSSESA